MKQRNLTLLGEWLSILYISKEVEAKELNTSGGVVKHPIHIKKAVRKELNTFEGVVKHPIHIKKAVRKKLDASRGAVRPPISKIVVRKYFVMLRKYINVRSGNMLFRFMISQGALECLY